MARERERERERKRKRAVAIFNLIRPARIGRVR